MQLDNYTNLEEYTKDAQKFIEDKTKELNCELLVKGYQVVIIETSEQYLEDENEDELSEEERKLYLMPMYEAFIEDDNEEQVSETTGRYVCIESVVEELEGFVEEITSEYCDAEKYINTYKSRDKLI